METVTQNPSVRSSAQPPLRIETMSAADKKSVEKFIDFAWLLYQPKNPAPEMAGWVPPLRMYVRDLLDVKKNPFYKTAEIQLFMAYRGDTPVGRIAAVDNHSYNKFQETNEGHYGFFECVNDQTVANALFDAAASWLKARGRNKMMGPFNPSTNHEAGLLVRGHSQFQTLMTTWNPKYYEELHVNAGLTGCKDLVAYWLPTEKIKDLRPGFLERAKRMREESPYKFRDFDLKNFDREVEMCFEIYNSAWEKNWGFFPMSKEEFKHMAKDMKMLVDPNFFYICEKDGEPVGFMMAFPDFHHVYKRIPSGRLTPMAIIKMLLGKKMLKTVRIIALGVKPEFRGGGVFAQFTAESFLRANEVNLIGGEASWILEDNEAMNKPWRDIGAPLYRRWRVYERSLA